MYKYKCRGCEKTIKLQAEHLGRKLKCKCGVVFRAPVHSNRSSNPDQRTKSANPQVPPIEVTCPSCFTTLRAKAELAGKACKCRCGAKLQVPSNREASVLQTSDANLMDMSDPMALPLMAEASPKSASKFQTRYNNPEAYKSAPPPPKKTISMPKRTPSRTSSGSGANYSVFLDGPVIGGVGMMLGATIWFVVGWWAGYIFFYPPILFCIGFGSAVKGLID